MGTPGGGAGVGLSAGVVRGLDDKLYEKRKAAALEVEQVVKGLVDAGDDAGARALLHVLVHEFALAPQANPRKGGLIGLAAFTVGLSGAAGDYLVDIVPPVLKAFTDVDPRVRYYACESLYNIAKVARESFARFFADVFDVLYRLSADSDPNVQNAAHLLDRLMKDIVAESPDFTIADFVPALRERLEASTNPYLRQFMVGWITALDSIPDLDMLQHLPDLVGGLFAMLSDSNREIRLQVDTALNDFLVGVQEEPSACMENEEFVHRIADVLIEQSRSDDAFVQLTSILWLKTFVNKAKGPLLPKLPEVVAALLPCVSLPEVRVSEAALLANREMLDFVGTMSDAEVNALDPAALLIVAEGQIGVAPSQEKTHIEALAWVSLLLKACRNGVLEHLGDLLPPLLDATAEGTDKVVHEALGVQAQIAQEPDHFRRLVESLVERFRGVAGQEFLQHRGGLAIRRLCAELGAKVTLCAVSATLAEEEDSEFASRMVQVLNILLLTAPEMLSLREELRGALANPAGASLFRNLYVSWANSAAATLALCLLSRAFEHAVGVLQVLGSLEATPELLMEIDSVVAMIESPIFSGLRVALLEPAENPHLLKALYAILMFLPQSRAYETLCNRLQNVPTLELLKLNALMEPKVDPGAGLRASVKEAELAAEAQGVIDFPSLLKIFERRQTLFLQSGRNPPE